MAQQRFRNYKNSLTSEQHNIFNLLTKVGGRYFGFDEIINKGVLDFSINHDQTGVRYKDSTNTLHGPCGAILTPQGVAILEDEETPTLSIVSNSGNPSTRYDLIIFTHSFTSIPGGADGTYSVLQGPFGSSIKPIPDDPYKQVILGVLEVPPGATDISECIYQKSKAPDSGDGEDARLIHPNIFKAIQFWCASSRIYTAADYTSTPSGIGISQFIQFDQDGNCV